jgi:ABC-type taurine transport system ATPase subunit
VNNTDYLNEFIDKNLKSIKEDRKDDLKYTLLRLYEKEGYKLMMVINDIEEKILDGGLLVPMGLLKVMEDEFPFSFFDIIEEMQVKRKIKEAEENASKIKSETDKNNELQTISKNVYGKKYEDLLEEQQEIVKKCYVE